MPIWSVRGDFDYPYTPNQTLRGISSFHHPPRQWSSFLSRWEHAWNCSPSPLFMQVSEGSPVAPVRSSLIRHLSTFLSGSQDHISATIINLNYHDHLTVYAYRGLFQIAHVQRLMNSDRFLRTWHQEVMLRGQKRSGTHQTCWPNPCSEFWCSHL